MWAWQVAERHHGACVRWVGVPQVSFALLSLSPYLQHILLDRSVLLSALVFLFVSGRKVLGNAVYFFFVISTSPPPPCQYFPTLGVYPAPSQEVALGRGLVRIRDYMQSNPVSFPGVVKITGEIILQFPTSFSSHFEIYTMMLVFLLHVWRMMEMSK